MKKTIHFNIFAVFVGALLYTVFFYAHAVTKAAGLPPELQDLQIRNEFISSQSKKVGLVRLIKGDGKLIVVHRPGKEAYYGREGNAVYEKDALYTLDCRCRIEFEDKNVLFMAPETHLDIEKVSSSFFAGKKESFFGMTRGKAVIYALRLFGYRDIKLRLKTPHAMVGIRGTKFGAEIDKPNPRNTVGDLLTRTYVFEGTVDMTSLIDGKTQPLRENEILEADKRGLGTVQFDPVRTRAFLESIVEGMEPQEQPQLTDESELDRFKSRWQDMPGPRGMGPGHGGMGPGHGGMGGHRH